MVLFRRRIEEDQRLVQRPRCCSCRGRGRRRRWRYSRPDSAPSTGDARGAYSRRSRERIARHVTEVRVVVILVPLVALRVGAAQTRVARRFARPSRYRVLTIVVFACRGISGTRRQKRVVRFRRDSVVSFRRHRRVELCGPTGFSVWRRRPDCGLSFHSQFGCGSRWIPALQPCLGTCKRRLLQTVRRLCAAAFACGSLRERACRRSAQKRCYKSGEAMLDGPSFHDAVSGAIKVPTRPGASGREPMKNYFLFFVGSPISGIGQTTTGLRVSRAVAFV